MDLLIDTHAVIWFITEDKKLPQKTRQILENVENNIGTFHQKRIEKNL